MLLTAVYHFLIGFTCKNATLMHSFRWRYLQKNVSKLSSIFLYIFPYIPVTLLFFCFSGTVARTFVFFFWIKLYVSYDQMFVEFCLLEQWGKKFELSRFKMNKQLSFIMILSGHYRHVIFNFLSQKYKYSQQC